MNNQGAWKTLLIQAFRDTEFDSESPGLLALHRFIRQALANAGIVNRSPFTLTQLIRIWYQSDRQAEQLRQHCIDTVINMQKPAYRFEAPYFSTLIMLMMISVVTVLTPRTATTSRSADTSKTLLVDHAMPVADIDSLNLQLPLQSDYLESPNPPLAELADLRSESGLLNPAWIRLQKDSAYSLQLLSATDPQNLQRFCEQHGICEQSAFYQTELNGKTLYRLLFGTYPNHQAAKQAKSQLPTSLQQTSPWARQFAQIKNEL